VIRSAVVLSVLVALAAVALWCSALIAGLGRTQRASSEATAWRRLLRPLVAPALVFAAVMGWAVADGDECEAAGVTLTLLAVVAAAVILRALVRAARAARVKEPIVAGTAGILRPTVCVSPELCSLLGERALAALLAHERAHARHRDPARQLLAQLVTDLQWPFPGARQRLVAWRQALEVARDDEALAEGADAADLAHAIVTGARFARSAAVDHAVAQIMGGGEALTDRVRRLLADSPPRARSGTGRSFWFTASVGLALSLLVGMTAGDELIESLLAILP